MYCVKIIYGFFSLLGKGDRVDNFTNNEAFILSLDALIICFWHRGVVVIKTVQLHSMEPDFWRFAIVRISGNVVLASRLSSVNHPAKIIHHQGRPMAMKHA